MSVNPFGDPAEQLAARFSSWEQRGRGWQIHPHPVELEPPFRPYKRFVRIPASVDDGRRPGALLSALTFGLAGRRSEAVGEAEEAEPVPMPAKVYPLTELHLLLSETFDPGKDAAGDLVDLCRLTRRPISFELIGRGGVVSMQVACATGDVGNFSRHLESLAPEVALLAREEFLATMWQATSGVPLIADLGLSEEFMRPLASGRELSSEPLVQVISSLAAAGTNEIALVQVLFAPTRHRWPEHIVASLTDADGRPFFTRSSDLLKQAQQKVAAPLFACRMRLAAKGGNRQRSLELARGVLAAFQQFSSPPDGNSFIALDHEGMPPEVREFDLLNRCAHRSGMLVNGDELTGLVHLPGRETLSTGFERLRQRTKAAPETSVGHELVLGDNLHRGHRQAVTLSLQQRSRHVYVIGGSGTGKSTLLLNLICQDVEAGRGVAVLDPHGDLVDAVLARISSERVEDVVLIDPADAEHPVGINVLAAHTELERTLLASDLVAAFRRHATSWGDQMNAVFANAVLAFLESSQGGTLLELRRFLVEKEYRTAFLRTVADDEVRYYWEKEYPLLRGNAQAPILTRLDGFLRPRLVRNIVANPGASLDFRSLVDERKIVLVKLAQGGIGEENAHLLGALILTKLQQVALSRQDVDAAQRSPFSVYLDEFHHFATPTTSTLLSGVRKYGLGLTLAHQNLSQVPAELVDSVLANAGTRICFRLGDSDARKLADGFSFFEAGDLQNLDVGEAICRIGRSEADFNVTTRPVPERDPESARLRVEEVIAVSRRQWSRPIPETPPARAAVPVFAIVGPPPEAAPGTDDAAAPVVPAPAAPAISGPLARPRSALVTPGRGGQQHKYLQTLIKRFGEDRGFKATIELPVLDGHGSVDVALERENVRVAVEISITTPTEHELQNLAKCLAAGFDVIVLVSTDEKGRKKMRTAVGKALDEEQVRRAHCLLADEIPAFLDQLARPHANTETVAGYKVKVQVTAPTTGGDQGQRKTIREIIARSLGRGEKG